MTEQPNPYAPADVDTRAPIGAPPSQGLSAQDLKKLEALVKDANQFWIAIIMCVVCSSVGALIIAPWYGVRLMQWSDLARRYPNLIAPGAQPNSLPAKFQSARTKLWVGIGFGFLMMALGVLFVAATLLIRPV